VTISSAAIGDGDVAVRYENRSLTTSGGKLHDHFEPFAVHVYSLPAPAPAPARQ
jgi:hypothetical protein